MVLSSEQLKRIHRRLVILNVGVSLFTLLRRRDSEEGEEHRESEQIHCGGVWRSRKVKMDQVSPIRASDSVHLYLLGTETRQVSRLVVRARARAE